MLLVRGSEQRCIFVFCDGSTGALAGQNNVPALRSAPLACGAAAVARAWEGRILGLEWQELPAMTNNEAEYAGLLLGIRLAQRLAPQEAVFVLDSEVVAGQMSGRFAVNSRALRAWHRRAVELARDIPVVHFQTVPREWNRLADGLAAQAGIPWPWLRGRCRVGLRGHDEGPAGAAAGSSWTER